MVWMRGLVAVAAFAAAADAIPEDFECAWRGAAMRYAGKLQPWLTPAQKAVLATSLSTPDTVSRVSPPPPPHHTSVAGSLYPHHCRGEDPRIPVWRIKSHFVVPPGVSMPMSTPRKHTPAGALASLQSCCFQH